jgi:hypothetical protein
MCKRASILIAQWCSLPNKVIIRPEKTMIHCKYYLMQTCSYPRRTILLRLIYGSLPWYLFALKPKSPMTPHLYPCPPVVYTSSPIFPKHCSTSPCICFLQSVRLGSKPSRSRLSSARTLWQHLYSTAR